jgi:hypothetical protein
VFTNHLPPTVGNCLDSNVSLIDWKSNDILSFMYKNFVEGNYYNAGMECDNKLHAVRLLENVLSEALIRKVQLLRYHSAQVTEDD